MKQKNIKSKITSLFLLSLSIIIFAGGCGKSGEASIDLNNYATNNYTNTPDNEPGLDNIENDNQTANYSSPDIISSAILSWSEPSFNADGSPLSGDLAGYIIYYGFGSDNYTESVDIGNLRSASVNDLTSGTWCFSVTAYDSVGNESDLSEEICKTIS